MGQLKLGLVSIAPDPVDPDPAPAPEHWLDTADIFLNPTANLFFTGSVPFANFFLSA